MPHSARPGRADRRRGPIWHCSLRTAPDDPMLYRRASGRRSPTT